MASDDNKEYRYMDPVIYVRKNPDSFTHSYYRNFVPISLLVTLELVKFL